MRSQHNMIINMRYGMDRTVKSDDQRHEVEEDEKVNYM